MGSLLSQLRQKEQLLEASLSYIQDPVSEKQQNKTKQKENNNNNSKSQAPNSTTSDKNCIW